MSTPRQRYMAGLGLDHSEVDVRPGTAVAFGNAEEEEYRSGIQKPKADAQGKFSAKELAEHHAKMAELHTKKSGTAGQALKTIGGLGSKDFWHKLNPLHHNFWDAAGGGLLGAAIGGPIGAIAGAAGAGIARGRQNATSNKEAALRHASLATHYAAEHHAGRERVYERDAKGRFD